MPVSKKRKKEGKPVHRKEPAAANETGVVHPDEKPHHEKSRVGKPSNPFVAAQPKGRSAQRGR